MIDHINGELCSPIALDSGAINIELKEENNKLYDTIVKLNDRVVELVEDVDKTDNLLTYAVYNMTDEQYSDFLEYEKELNTEKDLSTSAYKIK